MTLPLSEVQKIKRKASKPGNIYDEYIRVQDINNAVNKMKDEFFKLFPNIYMQKSIIKIIDKWLRCK